MLRLFRCTLSRVVVCMQSCAFTRCASKRCWGSSSTTCMRASLSRAVLHVYPASHPALNMSCVTCGMHCCFSSSLLPSTITMGQQSCSRGPHAWWVAEVSFGAIGLASPGVCCPTSCTTSWFTGTKTEKWWRCLQQWHLVRQPWQPSWQCLWCAAPFSWHVPSNIDYRDIL